MILMKFTAVSHCRTYIHRTRASFRANHAPRNYIRLNSLSSYINTFRHLEATRERYFVIIGKWLTRLSWDLTNFLAFMIVLQDGESHRSLDLSRRFFLTIARNIDQCGENVFPPLSPGSNRSFFLFPRAQNGWFRLRNRYLRTITDERITRFLRDNG